MEDLPRYRNEIYVTEKKHLTRSINKLIEYKGVKKIFLSLASNNSFELEIDCEDESFFNYGASFLVYDRANAMYKRTNTDCIFNVIDIIEMNELFKKDILDELRELISKYQKEDKIFNTFFEQDKNDMIEKIKSFINIDGSFIQKPSGKKINTKDMVARRLYQSVLNRLNYDHDFYFNLSQMSKEIKTDELEYTKNAIESIDNITSRIKKDKNEKRNTIANEHKDSNISYIDCIIALELTDNLEVEIDEFYRTIDIDLAYTEKIRHEEDIDAEIREYNIKEELTLFIKEEIEFLFKEYVKIDRYFKLNKKNFTMNSITRYIKEFSYQMGILNKLGGIRRRKKVLELKNIYGDNFREFYKVLKKLDSETKKAFSKKILLLKKYEYMLNEFNDEELEKVFNGTLELDFNPKDEYESITTLHEIKIRDNYFDKWDELLKLYDEKYILENEYDLDEYFEVYEEISENVDNLEKEIDELQKKYLFHGRNNLHPWAQEHLHKIKNV